MKNLSLLLLTMLLFNISKGQTKPLVDYNINSFLQNHIRMPAVMVENGIMPATLVVVYVNKKAGVDSVCFSKSTLPEVTSEVTRTIDLMKDKPYFKGFKKKILVIPIIYVIKIRNSVGYADYSKILDEQTEVIRNNQLIDYKIYTYLSPVIIKKVIDMPKSTIVY